MKINDIVVQEYRGIRRFGVVCNTENKNGWLHASVTWVNDDKYLACREHLQNLKGLDLTRKSYRIDELTVIDARKDIDTLRTCLDVKVSASNLNN